MLAFKLHLPSSRPGQLQVSHGAFPVRAVVSSPNHRHRRKCFRIKCTVKKTPDQSKKDVDTPSSSPPSPGLDPVTLVQWGGTLPERRRILIGGLGGLSIALGGNLFGITSALLALDNGTIAAVSRLDSIFPVRGYKRCFDYQNGYEFIYPAHWLADQRLYRQYAERIERERSLDPPPLRSVPRGMRSDVARSSPTPTAAFGPPGSTGEENISVIVAPIGDEFRIESLGPPKEAAQRFLDTIVAPPGSGKRGTLVNAIARQDPRDDRLYYQMEFIVDFPGKFTRHNVAVYGAGDGLLYTLNCQTPESQYKQEIADQFAAAASSFRIFSKSSSKYNFPQQL